MTTSANERPDGASSSEAFGPRNIIWVFGTARVGSTWLVRMMTEAERYTMWSEPRVGFLFGDLYYRRARPWQPDSEHFILGRYRESWTRSIRNFILDAVGTSFPELGKDDHLIVKEPNGSIGAPLIMDALPESRMILQVRDPRDVAASALDVNKRTSWAAKNAGKSGQTVADTKPNVFIKGNAKRYVQYLGNARQAYEAHKGPKAVVRYEDLRVDTLNTLEQLYSSLDLPFEKEALARAVDKHSWENIPDQKKGEGKFLRKAKPGGYTEDLTPRQVEIVEKETASLLEEFYGN